MSFRDQVIWDLLLQNWIIVGDSAHSEHFLFPLYPGVLCDRGRPMLVLRCDDETGDVGHSYGHRRTNKKEGELC